jgi:folate-binding protein YgfZ
VNSNPDAYHLHRIKLGIPATSDIGSSQTFPHEANFDQLGGVSFTKGCYVGQEVVSRMQHRGTTRSRIIPITFDGEMSEPNAEIRAGGKKIGHILSTISGNGLALVRLDRAKSALETGDAIQADGKGVELYKPDWLKFKT